MVDFHFLRVLVAASRLDCIALNPVRSGEAFSAGLSTTIARVKQAGQQTSKTKTALRRIARLFGELLSRDSFPVLSDGAAVWFAGTKNQEKALLPAFARYSGESVWIDADQLNQLSTKGWKYLPLYLPALVVHWLKADRRVKGTFRNSWRHYLRIYGIYVVARRWIHKHSPGCFIISNDHTGRFCTLNKAAQDEGVKTIYIQHACVADHFPPLTFDYAFLDGLDSLTKYGAETRTKIFLTGIAKYDEELNPEVPERHKVLSISRLGVCFNLLDSFDYTVSLLSKLQQEFPNTRIIARLHPGTPPIVSEPVHAFCCEHSIRISNGIDEDSFSFLRNLDVLVCGASSIILEAALVRVPSVAVLPDDSSDVYGFSRNGLCPRASSIEFVAEKVREAHGMNPADLKERAAYYCAGFGDEGRPCSSKLVADLVKAVCRGEEFVNWTRTSTTVYEWTGNDSAGLVEGDVKTTNQPSHPL